MLIVRRWSFAKLTGMRFRHSYVALLASFAACTAAIPATTFLRAQTPPPSSPSTQPGTKIGVPGVPTVPRPPKLPKLPVSLKVPTTFEGIFAERDTRSVAALDYLRCMQGTVDALRSGLLGNVSTAWSITCVKQGKEWRGVFGELTDSTNGMRVRVQYAFRGNGVVVKDAIDTALVGGTARALLRGLSSPLARNTKSPFVPIALSQGTFIEVWIVPVPGNPSRVVVGGDSLIQMSKDGVRELGHSRETSPIRSFAIEPKGPVYTLESGEERIPLLSELVIAHMALGMVPEVRIRTHQYESALTRTSTTWTHTKR